MKFNTIYQKDDFITVEISPGVNCLVNYDYKIVEVVSFTGEVTAKLKLAKTRSFRMLYKETYKKIDVVEFDEDFVIKKIHEKEDAGHQ